MSDYKVTDTELTSIANAIRAKTGKSAQIEFPTEFVSEIGSISGDTPDELFFWGVYDISMNITYENDAFVFSWISGVNIGASIALANTPDNLITSVSLTNTQLIVLPATASKIYYHVNVGSRSYDNYATFRFAPIVFVSSLGTLQVKMPDSADVLKYKRYATANLSMDDELDISDIDQECYLYISSHGCDASFSNIRIA